jgi:hypothetical protein
MGVNPRSDEDAAYFEQTWKKHRGEQVYRWARPARNGRARTRAGLPPAWHGGCGSARTGHSPRGDSR